MQDNITRWRRAGGRQLAVWMAALIAVAWACGLLGTTSAVSQAWGAAPVFAQAGAPAGGKAPTKSLLDIIQDGGVLMIPLGFCSFIMVVFIFERAISLRRGRVIPRPFVKRFLHQLRDGQLHRDEAIELCKQNGSPVALVFAAAARKWGRPAVEVEQAVIDTGERVVNGLRKYVRMFNGIATVSPLLGLLGTVFGMIASFNAIAASDAMGKPGLLAAGISEALITTATGLSIAIPALTVYLFFLSRVDQLIVEIDGLGQEVVGIISAEAIAEAAETKRPRRREAAAAA